MTLRVLSNLRGHGIVETAKRVYRHSANLWRWHLDSRFDRRFKVETTGIVAAGDLKTTSENLPHAIWYEGVPVSIFRQLIRRLPVNLEEYVFVDFGSGKGRALLLASDFPFARIIGVEFSPELHAVALRNIKTYRNSKQLCRRIESVCLDAVEFSLPPDACVLFFYSPFRAPVMARVIDNIRKSLQLNPRRMFIVFYGSNQESLKMFREMGLKSHEITLRRDYTRPTTRQGLIVEN